jgi:hypothetical protein
MGAFPPHFQLAFPVASELALSACTHGLRLGDRFRLHFSVGLAASSLSVSSAGSTSRPAFSALHIQHFRFDRRRRLALTACVADTYRFRLHFYRCEFTVCLRLALDIRLSSAIAIP